MFTPRHWVCFVLASALAGCIEPKAMVPCGDVNCPPGFECLPDQTCASPAQLEACAGQPDGTSCMVEQLGVCKDGACIMRVCANNHVEPGEACDDGNLMSGDGCNALCSSTETCGNAIVDPGEECDCGDGTVASSCAAANDGSGTDPAATCNDGCRIVRCGNGVLEYGEVCDDGNFIVGDGCIPGCNSNEKCGNGFLDLFVGEECDDHNTLSHDGCNSACRPEDPRWEGIDLAPGGRWKSAVAYDAHHGRLVMFGGSDSVSSSLGDTWEWNGSGWRGRHPAVSPGARFGHAMAYDAKRKRVVLFGGATSTMLFGDTWEWDGTNWTKRSPLNAPSARRFHAMAYDGIRQRVVLFGGTDGSIPSNETWEWDGTTWTKAQPATAPGARESHAMAFDAKRGVVVMFGGNISGPLREVWEWNGVTWANVTPTAGGPSNWAHAMAYDPTLGEVVTVGGLYGSTSSYGWNGTQWTSRGFVAYETMYPSAAFDVALGKLVMVGGYTQVSPPGPYAGQFHDQVLIRPPTGGWSIWPRPAPPGARTDAAMAYDSARAGVIMTGGFDLDETIYAETWSWDGMAWQTEANGSLGAWYEHRLVDDPARGRTLIVGGLDDFGTPRDATWAWDGAWSDAMTSSPLGGGIYAAAIARAPGGFVGYTANEETFSWDGAAGTWTNVSSTPAPVLPPVASYVLAYDRRRSRTILAASGQTWTWDGSSWTDASTTLGPLADVWHSLVYDPTRGATILFGGLYQFGYLNEAWSFDGTVWSELDASGPVGRGGHVSTYDPRRGELLVFGGNNASGALDDMWALRWDGVKSVEEACYSRTDVDGDSMVGCNDPDCWPYCDPRCPPGAMDCATSRPKCGDGVCDAALETCACESDCPGQCPIKCGDFVCEGTETNDCKGDCP